MKARGGRAAATNDDDARWILSWSISRARSFFLSMDRLPPSQPRGMRRAAIVCVYAGATELGGCFCFVCTYNQRERVLAGKARDACPPAITGDRFDRPTYGEGQSEQWVEL